MLPEITGTFYIYGQIRKHKNLLGTFSATPLSGFKPVRPDVVLVCSQRCNHSAKLDT